MPPAGWWPEDLDGGGLEGGPQERNCPGGGAWIHILERMPSLVTRNGL